MRFKFVALVCCIALLQQCNGRPQQEEGVEKTKEVKEPLTSTSSSTMTEEKEMKPVTNAHFRLPPRKLPTTTTRSPPVITTELPVAISTVTTTEPPPKTTTSRYLTVMKELKGILNAKIPLLFNGINNQNHSNHYYSINANNDSNHSSSSLPPSSSSSLPSASAKLLKSFYNFVANYQINRRNYNSKRMNTLLVSTNPRSNSTKAMAMGILRALWNDFTHQNATYVEVPLSKQPSELTTTDKVINIESTKNKILPYPPANLLTIHNYHPSAALDSEPFPLKPFTTTTSKPKIHKIYSHWTGDQNSHYSSKYSIPIKKKVTKTPPASLLVSVRPINVQSSIGNSLPNVTSIATSVAYPTRFTKLENENTPLKLSQVHISEGQLSTKKTRKPVVQKPSELHHQQTLNGNNNGLYIGGSNEINDHQRPNFSNTIGDKKKKQSNKNIKKKQPPPPPVPTSSLQLLNDDPVDPDPEEYNNNYSGDSEFLEVEDDYDVKEEEELGEENVTNEEEDDKNGVTKSDCPRIHINLNTTMDGIVDELNPQKNSKKGCGDIDLSISNNFKKKPKKKFDEDVSAMFDQFTGDNFFPDLDKSPFSRDPIRLKKPLKVNIIRPLKLNKLKKPSKPKLKLKDLPGLIAIVKTFMKGMSLATMFNPLNFGLWSVMLHPVTMALIGIGGVLMYIFPWTSTALLMSRNNNANTVIVHRYRRPMSSPWNRREFEDRVRRTGRTQGGYVINNRSSDWLEMQADWILNVINYYSFNVDI